MDIFANDRLSGFPPSMLISPQEGRVRRLSGAGAEYVSYAWAHGSDEFVYQIRYGTGSNDFCNARVQITVANGVAVSEHVIRVRPDSSMVDPGYIYATVTYTGDPRGGPADANLVSGGSCAHGAA